MKKHGPQLAFWISYAVGVVLGVLIAQSADASLLAATPIDGAPIVTQPGGTFAVNITSQTPPTTGLAYVMLASQPGIFTLIGRDVTGSPFTVLDVADGDTASGLGVLGVSAGLDPTNGSDLGADTLGDSVTGTQHVATLSFRVADDALPGVYTIQPWDDLIDGGWYGPGPDFDRSIYDGFQGVSVAVTPEPGLLMALVGLLLLRRPLHNRRANDFAGCAPVVRADFLGPHPHVLAFDVREPQDGVGFRRGEDGNAAGGLISSLRRGGDRCRNRRRNRAFEHVSPCEHPSILPQGAA